MVVFSLLASLVSKLDGRTEPLGTVRTITLLGGCGGAAGGDVLADAGAWRTGCVFVLDAEELVLPGAIALPDAGDGGSCAEVGADTLGAGAGAAAPDLGALDKGGAATGTRTGTRGAVGAGDVALEAGVLLPEGAGDVGAGVGVLGMLGAVLGMLSVGGGAVPAGTSVSVVGAAAGVPVTETETGDAELGLKGCCTVLGALATLGMLGATALAGGTESNGAGVRSGGGLVPVGGAATGGAAAGMNAGAGAAGGSTVVGLGESAGP